MCFSSVDLPQPEPPRMTNTSPRRTSKPTCSKIVRPSKRAARSSTRITVPASAATAVTSPAGGTAAAKAPSSTTMDTMPPTTARGRRIAHRARAAPGAEPRAAADQADGKPEERRLPQPAPEVPQPQRVLQLPGDAGGDVAEREHHRAHAEQPGEVHQQRQHRHHQDRRQHPRQHQPGDRVDAHDAERVDLLVHPHGAELGREGRAGAPGQHHRRHQRAELPQQRDADQVRDVVLAPRTGAAPRRTGRPGSARSGSRAAPSARRRAAPPRPGAASPRRSAAARAGGRAPAPGHQRFAEEGDLVEHPVAAPERRAAEAAEPGQRVARRGGGGGRLQRPAGPLQHRPLRALGRQAPATASSRPPRAPAAAAARRRRCRAR